MNSKEYVVIRRGSKIYRVPKHPAETHEQAFQKALLLSTMDNSLSSQVKWSIVCAQQMKKKYGLEYTSELEEYLH